MQPNIAVERVWFAGHAEGDVPHEVPDVKSYRHALPPSNSATSFDSPHASYVFVHPSVVKMNASWRQILVPFHDHTALAPPMDSLQFLRQFSDMCIIHVTGVIEVGTTSSAYGANRLSLVSDGSSVGALELSEYRDEDLASPRSLPTFIACAAMLALAPCSFMHIFLVKSMIIIFPWHKIIKNTAKHKDCKKKEISHIFIILPVTVNVNANQYLYLLDVYSTWHSCALNEASGSMPDRTAMSVLIADFDAVHTHTSRFDDSHLSWIKAKLPSSANLTMTYILQKTVVQLIAWIVSIQMHICES